MNITELLGGLVQSGMSASSNYRMKNYLDQLAAGLGIAPQVTGRIRQMVGLQPA